MKIYQLYNCGNSYVEVSLSLQEMGFLPDSFYYVYFLDHSFVNKNDNNNIIELQLLPFSISQLQNLYYVQIQLNNVPHATGKAVEQLSKQGIDILNSYATDSIAGKVGSFETIILSKKLSLDEIDKNIIREVGIYPELNNYILPFNKPISNDKERYFSGRYIHGRKVITDFESFNNSIVFDTNLEKVRLIYTGDKYRIDVPEQVITYLNQKYKVDSFSLNDYHVAIVVEPEFNKLSINFLNPKESIVHMQFNVNDKHRVLYAVTDYLGSIFINFRVVSVRNIDIGRRMLIDIYCDISHTELPLYGINTMTRILRSKLRERLREENAGVVSNDLIGIKITPEYGYPKKLTNFGKNNLFEIEAIFFIQKIKNKYTIVAKEFTEERIKKNLEMTPEEKEVVEKKCLSYLKDYEASKIRTDLTKKNDTMITNNTYSFEEIDKQRNNIYRFYSIKNSENSVAIVYKNLPPKKFHSTVAEHIEKLPKNLNQEKLYDFFENILKNISFSIPSKEKFEFRKYLSREDYFSSSKDRFEGVSKYYIKEKFEVDQFPVLGNKRLSIQIKRILQRLSIHENEPIKIIDLGCGPGALTSLMVVNELISLGLESKIELTLVDISHNILERCIKWDIDIPTSLIDEHFISIGHYDKTISVIKKAKTICDSVLNLPDQSVYDLAISGFMFHHLNYDDKILATKKTINLLKDNGIFGIVDESVSYSQYLEYYFNHLNDEVEPGLESFIDCTEHKYLINSLDRGEVIYENEDINFYIILGKNTRSADEKNKISLVKKSDWLEHQLKLVQETKIQEVLNNLITFFKEVKNEENLKLALSLSFRYNETEKNIALGIGSNEATNIIINNIIKLLISLNHN